MKYKISRKLYILTIFSLLIGFSYTFARTQVDQFVVQTETTTCHDWTNFAYYVWQVPSYWVLLASWDNYTWKLNNHPIDGNGNPISRETYPQYISSVNVWNPYWALSKTPWTIEPNQTIPDFFFLSNIKPNNVSAVKFAKQFSGNYINTWWISRNQKAAQINIKISRQKVLSWVYNENSNYKRFDQNDNENSWLNTFTNSNLQTPSTKHSFCINTYVATCGDGVIDDPNKTGWNNTNGKQWILTSQWFVRWSNTWFNAEVCDSNTETGAACINGTLGCCNTSCSGFGWADEKCGDEIIQPAGDLYNGDPNNMSFEECDDGDTENDTDGMINGDDPNFYFCSSICLPTFTEAFVEVFIN